MAKIRHVDLAGLQQFKDLIEGKISDGDAKALKTVLYDEENKQVKFYKKAGATSIDVADFSITISEEQDISGLLEKISGGTTDNVVTIGEGGIVVDSGVAISDIAKKTEIEAVDTKVGNIGNLNTTAKTDVVVAINEIKTAVDNSKEIGKIELVKNEDNLTYTIIQGEEEIGVINIPKDMVVSTGKVVTFATGDTLPESVETAGTYIELTIANKTNDKIYINVGALVDLYTAKQNATQIQLVINSSTREISATIVAGSVGTIELADNAITTVKIADANVTLAKLAVDVTNAFDSAGSATAAETNAKTYADGLNTAMDTRVDSLEGKVGEGFEAVTTEEINALFTD